MTRILLALAAALALSACSGGEAVTRAAATFDPQLMASVPQELPGGIRVTSVEVKVPASLVVSEENSYKPRADIVWHEDPAGDRRAQVDDILTAAIRQGAAGAHGSRPVKLEVTVARFHAQTPKVRYTFGGQHELDFTMRFLDPKTGQDVMRPVRLDFDFPAYGGQDAVNADRQGITQRSRIAEQVSAQVRAALL